MLNVLTELFFTRDSHNQETPIEDLQDLLEAIDADAANLFSAKYMAEKQKQMSTNEAVYPRMQLLVSAKRSARMIIATRTTHDSLGTQWLAMLKKIYVKVCIVWKRML